MTVFFTLLLVGDPMQANAQRVALSNRASCPACTIAVRSVVELSGASQGGPMTTIQRNPSGEIYLLESGVIKVYGANGKFVRQIGRKGGGPGEYETVRNLLIGQDWQLHVLDAKLARHSIFSLDGKFIKSSVVTLTGGVGMSALLWDDNQLVVNSRSPSSRRLSPVVILGDNGRVRNLPDVSVDPTKRWSLERVLFRRSNGQLLIARPYTFELTLFSSDLTLLRTYLVPTEGFTATLPVEHPSDGMFESRLTPAILSVWEDETGVYILSVVPHTRWESASRPANFAALSPEARADLINRPRAELVLDVLDLEKRVLVNRFRLPSSLGLPFGSGYFASTVEDSVGEPILKISRLALVRR